MATKKTPKKFKKKKWFEIISPEIFGKKVIGKTLSEKPANIKGRTVKITLDNLTENKRLRYQTIIFKIEKIEKEKAYTEIVGHKADTGFINRLARRKKSKVDAIIDVTFKDKKKARITLNCLCEKKEDRKKEKEIRRIMLEEIPKQTKPRYFDSYLKELLTENKIKQLEKKCSKIAKIRRIEVVKSKLLKG